MTDPITTIGISVLALASLAAFAQGIRHFRSPNQPRNPVLSPAVLWTVIGIGAACLFIYRWLWITQAWQPLAAHVDGLLLITVIIVAVLTYLAAGPRWLGLTLFAAPMVSLLLLWAFCASTWTYRPFAIKTLEPVWTALHLGGVYAGTATAALSAIMGALFLYVYHRIKHKTDVAGLGEMSSLESLEGFIQRSATLGFVLLTLGLITGVILVLESPVALAEQWWLSPKVVIATLSWLVFALLMNVRYTTAFRGRRAACLAIGGFALLLCVYGIATAMPGPTLKTTAPETNARPLLHTEGPR